MAKIKRIVCYAVNGSGLGHVTRLMSVAKWLRRTVGVLERRPPEILFLTSSEATQVLLQAGFASFKLPSKTIVRQTGMDMLEYRRLARQFVWQTLGTFAPDLLVVDTFPSGSFDELLQLLDAPFQKGFIHRRVKPEYAQRPTFQAALGLYDSIVVPHASHGPHDAREAWCGEVLHIEREALMPAQQARAQLGVPPERTLVYVSAGGGGDPHSQAALASVVEALSGDPTLHLLVGAGPLYRGTRMGGQNLTWFTEPEVAPYMAACDAAISAGGYNTFHELLHLGGPSVFFAQAKVADDQAHRIQTAAQAGACLWLDDSALDPAALRTALSRALEARESLSANARAYVPQNGAARCARALLAQTYSAAQLAWAESVLTPTLALAFEAHGPEGQRTMAQWLPQLFPAVHIDSLESHPSFQALVASLPADAAQEVQRVLTATRDTQNSDAAARRLVTLLDESQALPGGISTLCALVENAMKKHPLANEPGAAWLIWLERLLTQLHGLLARCWEGWPQESVLQVYRTFPRLFDADLDTAFSTFVAMMDHSVATGLDFSGLLQKLRALKFTHKRITAQSLAALTGEEAT